MDDNLRTRAYRYARGRIPFGDSFVFADLRAAMVDDKGVLLRTLNGSIMEPGTDLYAMPDNVHVGSTIDELLAVIYDLEARLQRSERPPERDHLRAEGHDLDACMGRIVRDGATDDGFRGFIHAFEFSDERVRMAMLADVFTLPRA